MQHGLQRELKGRFSVSALLDPSPRCRERGGAETNQSEKPEPQARAGLTNTLSRFLRCPHQASGGVLGTAGHEEPWLISRAGPQETEAIEVNR